MNIKRLKVPSKHATEYLKNDKELSQYWEQLNRDCYGEIIIDSDTLDHVGHVFVWHTKRDKGFIFNLEVKPQYRRHGIGWILLDDAVKKYDGVDLLVDEDNTPAIKLYEKYGFETIKTVNGQLWMKLNQIKQEGVIMFFDRLGNAVTGEPIVEEPVVESYYDPNRPVRPGFEKPEIIQEGWFNPKPNKETSRPTTIEDVESMHGIVIDKDFKKFITENPNGCKFKYPDNKIVSKEILEFIDDDGDPSICSLNQFIDANCEYDGCIEIYDYCLYIGGWIDDKALYLATNKSSCAPEGSIIFADIIENGYDYTDRIFAKSFKDLLKNANIEKSIKEYSEMDIDEMSDYITEANEESKKARKNAQEFMRKEYGTSNPTSMTSKQRNRMKKWLKDNDYDPKTGTIATDMEGTGGKPFRVNLETNSSAGKPIGQKSNMPFNSIPNPLYPKEKYTPAEKRAYAGDRPLMNMPKEYMKRHPSISTGISKHEEGHIADYYGKIDDIVDKRIKADEHIKQSMQKGIDYSPTHTDIKENIADLYSVQHNKYKDKLRFLNVILSEDIHMQKKFKADWKDLCEKVYKKQSDDKPPIIDASSVETMRDSIKNLVSRTKANIKSYKTQLKTQMMYPSGKNLLNRLIDSGKDACNEYEKILRKWFIGKLLFKKVNYDDAKVMVDKAVWHDAKLAVDEAIRQNDGDIEIRKEFLKKYINEFAVEYGMSATDVIQEMYQTAFEDYVFQEDFEDEKPFDYDVFIEAKINAADRKELDDSCFGLVYTDENGEKIRKYPLTDKDGKLDENHVRQAVRFFNHCPEEHQHQLALNILHAAHKLRLDTTKWDTVNKAAEEKDDN